MCSSFEDAYLVADSLHFDFSDWENVYLIEAGKVTKLRTIKGLEDDTIKLSPKRVKRGMRSRLMQYDLEKAPVDKYGQGYNILHYAVKSKENSEGKEDPGHRGYIVYRTNTHGIKHMFCDCKDFFYRLYAPYVANGLSTWDIDSRYKKFQHEEHNKEWTVETNPKGHIFICKHLYRAIKDILTSDNFDKLLDRDEAAPQEKRLRQSIAKQLGQPHPGEEKDKEVEETPPVEKPTPPEKKVALSPTSKSKRGKFRYDAEERAKKKRQTAAKKKKATTPPVKKVSDSARKISDLPKKTGEVKKPVVQQKPAPKKTGTGSTSTKLSSMKPRKSSFEQEYERKDRRPNKSTK